MTQPECKPDPIFERFFQRQVEEGMALAASSDLLDLELWQPAPPHFVASYRCIGIVRERNGEIHEANFFQAGIWFPPDYLRRVDPFEILRWFGPSNIWHPNISTTVPLICVGRLAPGTPLVDILYQIFEIITYRRYMPREDDSLNRECCAWARENQHRLPTDPRPLKRRPLTLEVHPS